jgi:PAS domain S-box-containing protein
MKLRVILRIISVIAVVSASTAGYLVYAKLRIYALEEAHQEGLRQVTTIAKNLSAFLSENLRPVRVLAGMEAVKAYLADPQRENLAAVHLVLDHFKSTLAVDVCYLMDVRGTTVASSNRYDSDSFMGLNFSFRPYYQQAVQGLPGTYLALGTTSNLRGAYYSYPVYIDNLDVPSGIVVIKASIFFVERELPPADERIVVVTDPNGVVFISNLPDWHYQLLWRQPPATIVAIENSRQFGSGPWQWLGMRRDGPERAVDGEGEAYQLHEVEIDNYPGWKVVHLRRVKEISQAVSGPLARILGPVVLVFCLLIGGGVYLLYLRASGEIVQRKEAQRALRASEERYRSLYENTPAMLHSVNPDFRLVSVSNYWAKALGYGRGEVIGRPLTDFMTPESRHRAEQQVMPRFFERGSCQDVPYQLVKKDGAIMDVLLSAISDVDDGGRPARSLAVSMDVTRQKRAEAALRQAKEALSRYSRDLERQVRHRTREISGILRYTPAVIYMKDHEGRYRLVNYRFEQLFGVRNEGVRGKRDHEILPTEVADQFQRNDRHVLTHKAPYQVEEHIAQADGEHIYLSVKFPIYNQHSEVSGLCGIASDITVMKKAQNQLRRLSGSIMESQEKERAALSRELHDELGQVLTALRMDAVWLQKRIAAGGKQADAQLDEPAAERARGMRDLIDQTIEEVRGLAIRLRPGVLDHLGLMDALEWYTADFERRTGIACVFKRIPIGSLPDTVATAAYRIVQEALTNVARHAGATTAAVRLKLPDQNLEVTVADNGCGFDADGLEQVPGLGVAGMRERAALIGADLAVLSLPGKGTRVVLTVPLTDHLADAEGDIEQVV